MQGSAMSTGIYIAPAQFQLQSSQILSPVATKPAHGRRAANCECLYILGLYHFRIIFQIYLLIHYLHLFTKWLLNSSFMLLLFRHLLCNSNILYLFAGFSNITLSSYQIKQKANFLCFNHCLVQFRSPQGHHNGQEPAQILTPQSQS